MTHDLRETGQGEQVQAEVDLCTTLLIAATGTDRSLTQNEVDQLLGVPSAPRQRRGA